MNSLKIKLLSSSAIPVLVGAGIAVGGAVAVAGPGFSIVPALERQGALPNAKPRPGAVRLAACSADYPCAATNPCNPCAAKKVAANPCNPCAAKKIVANPCNPCAAKNPCNPCAAANPCNPCAANPCNPSAAGSAGISSECVVPRLRTAAISNPCAAKNPCNPCAATNPCNPCAANKGFFRRIVDRVVSVVAGNLCSPCNPCAAKMVVANPCNPCAATNPCNPCAANPCNPCGPSGAVELTSTEAAAAYACLLGELKAAYAKAGLGVVKDYDRWTNANTAPYVSDTHGGRLVNNYANSQGGNLYVKFEDSGTMPAGSVLAKDSFVAQPDGRLAIGPLFVMEKMNDGFNAESGDWRYTMVMPDGSVFGRTKGAGAASVEFCNACHSAVAEDQDYMFFLPEEHRASF